MHKLHIFFYKDLPVNATPLLLNAILQNAKLNLNF